MAAWFAFYGLLAPTTAQQRTTVKPEYIRPETSFDWTLGAVRAVVLNLRPDIAQQQGRLMMALKDEIAFIERMPKEALRARWRQAHKKDPPPGYSTKLMRGALIYGVQAERHGGLSAKARRKLERIVAKLEADPDAPIIECGAPAPGTRLIREWRGKRHVVEVLNDGFAYRGTVHGSLSEIARAITGARWSGPRFFGLKHRRKAA